MLKIINESLFSFNSEDDSNNYGAFSKLSINTSASILKKVEGSDDVTPSVRTFARLVSPDKNYHQHNLAVSTRYNESGHAQVLLKCTPEIKYDSTVYVIAFPFNGLIKPIPESDQYRILKGMISVSDQYSVSFNNKKFKKVLYLIVSPKMSLFTGENPVTSIPVTFDAYSYSKNKENPEAAATYNHESMTVDILSSGETVTWGSEVVPPIDMEQYKGIPLFTLYRRPEKKDDGIKTLPQHNSGVCTSVAAAFEQAEKKSQNGNRPTPKKGGNFYDKDGDDGYRPGNNQKKKYNNHR